MPRHTSLATVIEKNKVIGGAAFVMLMEVDVRGQSDGALIETLYFARNNEKIVFEGFEYKPAAFSFSTTQVSSEMPESTVTIQDLTGAINRYIDESNGGDGWVIRLKLLNTNNLGQPVDSEETLHVKGATIKGYTCTLTLGGRNPLMSRFPRRTQRRDRCPWIYKSEECGYTGEMPACDYSLQGPNGCAAHGNTLRFGGFPGLRKR